MADNAYISPEKWQTVRDRLARVGATEANLEERFVLGSGHGGQKINKTASCVDLLHLPTGIRVKCQQSRSRDVNRFLARRELCSRLEQRILGMKSEKRQEIERIRRQKRRRSRRQKDRMLADKRHRSGIKQLRSAPSGE